MVRWSRRCLCCGVLMCLVFAEIEMDENAIVVEDIVNEMS